MPDNIDQLPTQLSDDLERRLDHFDASWNDGTPDLEVYIPRSLRSETSPPRPQWRRYVAELLSVDLEHRLRKQNANPPPRIEDYFDRIRWLDQDELVLLELIPTEFIQRHQRGDAVSVAEYEQRFAHLGTAVQACLKVAGTELIREQSTRPPKQDLEQADQAGEVSASPTDTVNSNTPFESNTAAPESHGLNRTFGNYELEREIARGGMGIVYKATQRSLKRTVALKVILVGGFAQDEDVRRFQVEAEAAARLDHPNIVPIFEVGEEAGHHYFSMAYVKGPTLSALVSNQPMGPAKAALVMRDVAAAIQYAHDNNVIHRDLKPSNIMLEHGRTPRITDFGLARQTNVESGMTVTGQILGTPSYMPPEQALGHVERIDARSDVYSLGATLYYLITGRAPFSSASQIQTLAQVVQDDPLPPRRLNNHIPRDLENICLKCLSKSPEGRYQSAADLQADLDRFLSGVPTIARPLSTTGRLLRFCRRKPGIAALLASVIGLVALLLSVSTTAYIVTNEALQVSENQKLDLQIKEREERQARELAQQQTAKAEVAEERALTQAKLASDAEQREKATRKEVEANLRLAEFNIYLNGLQRTQQLWSEGQVEEARRLLTSLRNDLTLWDELHGWEYDHISGLLRQEQRVIEDAHQRPILTAAWSPDGTRLASAGQDQMIKIWDRQTRRLLANLQGHADWVRKIGFVGDGNRLLSISHDGTARLWNTNKGVLIDIVGTGLNDLTVAAIARDGNRWAWSNSAGQVTVRELDSDDPLLEWQTPDARITAMTFNAAGDQIAVADARTQSITIRPIVKDSQIVTVPNEEGTQFALAFNDDGKRLAAGGESGIVQVWNVATGQRTGHWTAHRESIYAIQFCEESDQLLTCSADQSIMLWSVSRESQLDTFRGHKGSVFAVAQRPESDDILSAGNDGSIHLWRPGRDQLALNGLSDHRLVTPSADGSGLRYVANGSLRQLSFAPNAEPTDLTLPTGKANGLISCIDPAAGMIVADGAQIMLCDADGQTVTVFPSNDCLVEKLCQSPNGLLLAAADDRQHLRVFDTATGETRWEQPTDARITCMQFTSDSNRLMIVDVYGATVVWHADSGESTLKAWLPDDILVVCPDPGSSQIAVGENNGAIRFFDAAMKETFVLRGHQQGVNDLAFTSDGRRLASAGEDRTVRVWAVDQQALLLTLNGHERPVRHVFWTDEGRSLISVDKGGTAIRWRTDVE